MNFRPLPLALAISLVTMTTLPAQSLACASCGCTLSSDWESQGLGSSEGLKLDFRYDYLNQDQLRSGSHSISAFDAARKVTPAGAQEVEQYTKNSYFTTTFDYAFNKNWGVNLQIPYIVRDHATLGSNTNGSTPADEAYTSQTSDLGDVKLIGRFQGFSEQHNTGIQFGLKLPTGTHAQTGISKDPLTPGEIATIDRGLQPGTGTTDLIVGAYTFDAINPSWDYFAQATYQKALDASDHYQPGDGITMSVGVRYMGLDNLQPQLQLNFHHVEHDRGSNADLYSTGGDLAYLSPGVVLPLDKGASIYSFMQLPLYQDVRGVQLAPRYTFSLGIRMAF